MMMSVAIACWLAAIMASVASAATVEYTFDIRPTLHLNPDCFLRREVLAVNNMVPGPVVRANLGDTLRVTINNHSPVQSVSIHWHGLHMKGRPYSDGSSTITQCALGPLESEVHEFIADVPGTHYWHGHTSLTRMDGMQGFVIVDDPEKKREEKLRAKYDDEILVFIQDYYHSTGAQMRSELDSNPFIWIGAPNSMLINGVGPWSGCDPDSENCDSECTDRGFASFDIEKGKTYRLRIINAAGLLAINFAIAGHRMDIVEADGTLVKRTRVDHLDMTAGQRYSVLLKADQEVGNYWARVNYRFEGSGPTGYASFRYAGSEEPPAGLPADADLPMGQPEASDLEAGPALDAKLRTKGHTKGLELEYDREIILVGVGGTLLVDGSAKYAMNNITQRLTSEPVIKTVYDLATNAGEWPVDLTGSGLEEVPDRPSKVWNYTGSLFDEDGPGGGIAKSGVPIISLQKGQVVQIVLQNAVPAGGFLEVHPWHMHGHSFYIVGQGVGSYDSETDQEGFNLDDPLRRDTASVWPLGWTAIRFKANNPGVWGFHCHVAPHFVMGMGVLLAVSPEELPPPPQGVTSCTKRSFDEV